MRHITTHLVGGPADGAIIQIVDPNPAVRHRVVVSRFRHELYDLEAGPEGVPIYRYVGTQESRYNPL